MAVGTQNSQTGTTSVSPSQAPSSLKTPPAPKTPAEEAVRETNETTAKTPIDEKTVREREPQTPVQSKVQTVTIQHPVKSPEQRAAENAQILHAAVNQHVEDIQQEQQTLRSGEQMASTQDALNDPGSKVYYHRVPGARFVMPNGLELNFLGGRLVTNDEEIIKELNKVANKGASGIFTDSRGIEALKDNERRLAQDAATNAHTD